MGADEDLMMFEVCGTRYKLSEYNVAIEAHKDEFRDCLSLLNEFPYTVKNFQGDAIEQLKNVAISIVYKQEKISLYGFIKGLRAFEEQLPLSDETNGLEVENNLELAVRHIADRNDYHSVVIETFRILQDFHFLNATARWALIEAHRILHFHSVLIWCNGWEQLWTRATWLNNAIIMYDSCFDKLIQAVWIGTESYRENKIGRESLITPEGLEVVYKKCWHRSDKRFSRIPSPYLHLFEEFQKTDYEIAVSNYAQRIKHRGGMRYAGMFPFGQTWNYANKNEYDSFNTRNEIDIDEVVDTVKDYHIGICKLASRIVVFLMEEFKKHGYLTGEDIHL